MGIWRNPLADRVFEPSGEPPGEPPGEPMEGDSLDLLQAIYRNPAADWGVRMRAAIAALPFERPKLAVTVNTSSEELGARLEAIRRKRPGPLIEARPEPASTSKLVTPVGAPLVTRR